MTKDPWQAEEEVSPDRAGRLVADRFPELAGRSVSLLDAGWDNTMIRVGPDRVFRFPRRRVAVDLLLVEIEVLPLLEGRLGVPIPIPLHVHRPGPEGPFPEEYPWPFVGYPFFEGETPTDRPLDRSSRERVAPLLGRFLRRLHDTPIDADRQARLAEGPFVRWDLARMEAAIRAELGFPDGVPRAAREGIESLFESVRSRPFPPLRCLVHGDLHTRNMLFDSRGDLAAVIDFGDLHWGHPGRDLGIVPMLIPPGSWTDFRAAYGPVSDDDWDLARLRALRIAAAFRAQAAATGVHRLEVEARRILDAITESRQAS